MEKRGVVEEGLTPDIGNVQKGADVEALDESHPTRQFEKKADSVLPPIKSTVKGQRVPMGRPPC